jgi:hypothetical protein
MCRQSPAGRPLRRPDLDEPAALAQVRGMAVGPSIDDLLSGRWREPSSGRAVRLPVRRIVIEPSLDGGEADLIAPLALGTRLALVSDPTPGRRSAAGWRRRSPAWRRSIPWSSTIRIPILGRCKSWRRARVLRMA